MISMIMVFVVVQMSSVISIGLVCPMVSVVSESGEIEPMMSGSVSFVTPGKFSIGGGVVVFPSGASLGDESGVSGNGETILSGVLRMSFHSMLVLLGSVMKGDPPVPSMLQEGFSWGGGETGVSFLSTLPSPGLGSATSSTVSRGIICGWLLSKFIGMFGWILALLLIPSIGSTL